MDAVRLSSEAGIALITLNRPSTLNAMSWELTEDLHATLDSVAADESIRVVILTGEGRGFCSGHDFNEFDQTSASVDSAVRIQQRMASLVLRIRSLPQPVIAAVNGPAAGGGFALALACDTRICGENALFNAAFIRVGLLGADMGLSYLLPKIVGLTSAFELMLTGRFVDAEDALRLGLVSSVFTADTLLDAAWQLAAEMAANSPLGLRMTKRLLWSNLETSSLAASMESENLGQVVLLHSEDHRAAVDAWRASHGNNSGS